MSEQDQKRAEKDQLRPQDQKRPQQENVESDDSSQVVDSGVPGQIQFPDRTVYAERAAAFAAGKEDTLYPPEDEPDDSTRQVYNTQADPIEPGDETGEETEPAAMRGMDTDDEDDDHRDDR
jgi:hypothetical protein